MVGKDGTGAVESDVLATPTALATQWACEDVQPQGASSTVGGHRLRTVVGRRAGPNRTGLAGLADTGSSEPELVSSLSQAWGQEDGEPTPCCSRPHPSSSGSSGGGLLRR